MRWPRFDAANGRWSRAGLTRIVGVLTVNRSDLTSPHARSDRLNSEDTESVDFTFCVSVINALSELQSTLDVNPASASLREPVARHATEVAVGWAGVRAAKPLVVEDVID